MLRKNRILVESVLHYIIDNACVCRWREKLDYVSLMENIL